MRAVLAAALPVLPHASWAIDYDHILVNDPSGSSEIFLRPGDTVTNADQLTGLGAAVDVSVAGNSVHAEGVTISTSRPNDGNLLANPVGVRATGGGTVTLLDSTVTTEGDRSRGGHALHAEDAGSAITATDSRLVTHGINADGVQVERGALVTLKNVEVTTHGDFANGIRVNGVGSTLKADGVTITNASEQGRTGVVGSQGAQIDLKDAGIFTPGVGVYLSSSQAALKDVTIRGGIGMQLNSVSLLDAQALEVHAERNAIEIGEASGAVLSGATLTSESGYGIRGGSGDSYARLSDVSITALGSQGQGIVFSHRLARELEAERLTVESTGIGIDMAGGDTRLSDSLIDTYGTGAYGLISRGMGAEVTLRDTRLTTRGDGAIGLVAGNGNIGQTPGRSSHFSLNGVRISAMGADAHGIWSYTTRADADNTLALGPGTVIDTQDGIGLQVSGGDHRVMLEDADIMARQGGKAEDGVLLHIRPAKVTSGGVVTMVETGQVDLSASASALNGHVIAASGTLDMRLSNGSTLSGAIRESGTGRVNSLALDGTSTWNVRGDSTLGTLSNAGTVAFSSPGVDGFKTLTVQNYEGGGTLVLNSQLGDDSSPTDRLVIDGGSASGDTGLRVINAGGTGAYTTYGIRLVQTVNGGTTAANAFHLDAGSTGYRASAGTLALNGYDYSLVRGGNAGVADDWYLTSSDAPPPGPIDPSDPVDPTDPADPTDPGVTLPPTEGAGDRNVSPESGAWAGNRRAALRLFSHSLRDRDARAADADAGSAGRALWTRIHGGHDSGLRMAEGRVDIETDSAMAQLGVDLLRAPLGADAALRIGLMAGYGDARTRSTSTLRLPGAQARTRVRATGSVSGYAAGLYATVYANDVTRLGAYADAWLQYGRYDNRVSSELGTARYGSSVWTASLETGYAFKPFAAGSALADIVVEPKAQLIHSRDKAEDATLQGMRMRNGSRSDTVMRAGVRIYPKPAPDAAPARIQPFLEANWIRNAGSPSVRMGSNTLDVAQARNALELKLGAQASIARNVQVSAQLVGTAGGKERGYGGMLNLSYRW